jgi:hypothetical protein
MMNEDSRSDEMRDEPSEPIDPAEDYVPRWLDDSKPNKLNVPLIVSALLFVCLAIGLLLPAVSHSGAGGATRSDVIELQNRLRQIENAELQTQGQPAVAAQPSATPHAQHD